MSSIATPAVSCRPSTRSKSYNRRHISVQAVASFQQTSLPKVEVSTSSYDAPESDLGWRQNFDSRYIRGKLIGAGSFGQVHMAVQKSSGIEVAVKTLPKIRGKLTKERTLDKITRETDMMERLQSCQGVVRLMECYEDENNVHLVTELCPGGDLQKYTEANGPLDERALALVAFEVLKIVKACHELGIIHGDVKPANFCLKDKVPNPFSRTSTSYLKAIDFGCSQIMGGRRLTKRTGTPVFMSPEIFARDYADKADVWSIGVMLYWLFCQWFPFFQTAEVVKAARLEEVADAVSNTPISYSFGPWPQMSPEGVDFVKQCLTRTETYRLNVHEALHHPWLTKHVSQEELEDAWRGRGAGEASHAA
ncbi:hypothetical protein CEUSTIGMA_g8138.t1 [Chlamydomonas eustigma]|uniref:Protein kinase domain-containing protein n=1 Tax=Chlamydomonas eustigma TaxID=1157962 RepID=A0A250XC96_9CHLO|nr:hypothetical protein CEUSTIGMA_g8138.t1 [Chlamydomonas eustigma]|eukprot:GAX80703.1 hypothetical protein CEUSTIGMA_g8138.t1 [Chlamydomonas eustigma]